VKPYPSPPFDQRVKPRTPCVTCVNVRPYYTQFLRALTKSSNHIICNYESKTLYSSLIYVKEKIKIYSYVTWMIKIPSMCCAFKPKSSITFKIFNQFQEGHMMNELILNRVNFDTISLKWKCAAQIHIFLGLSNYLGVEQIKKLFI
jgi:hypothetical protein